MAKKRKARSNNKKPMIFSPWNYKALILGLALVVIGFSAMYLENQVEGFISLYISPITIMAGYITVIFAILKHDRDTSQATDRS